MLTSFNFVCERVIEGSAAGAEARVAGKQFIFFNILCIIHMIKISRTNQGELFMIQTKFFLFPQRRSLWFSQQSVSRQELNLRGDTSPPWNYMLKYWEATWMHVLHLPNIKKKKEKRKLWKKASVSLYLYTKNQYTPPQKSESITSFNTLWKHALYRANVHTLTTWAFSHPQRCQHGSLDNHWSTHDWTSNLYDCWRWWAEKLGLTLVDIFLVWVSVILQKNFLAGCSQTSLRQSILLLLRKMLPPRVIVQFIVQYLFAHQFWS